MIARIALRILLVALGLNLAWPLRAQQTVPLTPDADQAAPAESDDKAIPPWHPISPGPVDGRIAYVTAEMLEKVHYSHTLLNSTLSAKFLDHYLEALDPQHVHFIQADIAEFAHYRSNLDRLTLTPLRVADTTPACEIFNRFLLRLEQHVAFVDDVLKNDKFDFDADERITINRHELPYPKDLAEARQLWRERLKFEYLQELLAKADAKNKAPTPAASGESSPQIEPAPTLTDAPTAKPAPKPKTEAEEIVETLANAYHRNLRIYTDWDHQDVLQAYLGTLAHLYDPHSEYMGPAPLDTFAISMNLSLTGIGAELFQDNEGYCTIRRLLPGGPATKSNLVHEKDRIVAVAQSNQPPVNVVGMSLPKAVTMIRGPKGTEVRLTMIPAGSTARTLVSLIRDEVKLEDQEAKAKIIEMPGKGNDTVRLGVIELPSFYANFDPTNVREKSEPKSTTADVSKLLEKLKQENVNGVVLDLRNNGGGSLEEAVRLTGLFIKQGPVVQVKDWEGTIQPLDDTDPSVLYDGPLIVLTSRFSASASEIVAGALQDYGRALIVGESSTHGKGTVQAVNTLKPFMHLPKELATNDPGALKLTIKKFYRPSGASTQLKGVVPDIILPSINESREIGESAMDNPLPWDTVPAKSFDHLNRVTPFLPELRQHSAQRLAADPEFAYVREDIEQYKKLQADKTISLNEKQRLKEKEEADARQKARDKERLARKEPAAREYDLTLKLAALPGLPPPVQKTNSTLAKLSHPAAITAAVSTNSTALAANAAGPDAKPAAADEEKPPAPDAELQETERILVDYLAVLSKDNVLTAGH